MRIAVAGLKFCQDVEENSCVARYLGWVLDGTIGRAARNVLQRVYHLQKLASMTLRETAVDHFQHPCTLGMVTFYLTLPSRGQEANHLVGAAGLSQLE